MTEISSTAYLVISKILFWSHLLECYLQVSILLCHWKSKFTQHLCKTEQLLNNTETLLCKSPIGKTIHDKLAFNYVSKFETVFGFGYIQIHCRKYFSILMQPLQKDFFSQPKGLLAYS